MGDGYDGLTSDYIINGTPILFNMLAAMFSHMIIHAHAVKSFCVSTMVPIPKDKRGNLSDSQNYRGIALGSIVYKVLELCIIDKQLNLLHCDDLMFAYKQKLSTIHCVGAVKETISYYLAKNSNVYMCMLDASKAFDRVYLPLLFEKMLDRGICRYICRFLLKTYVNQKMCVCWDDCFSSYFDVRNGVKQGGVLSPLLFNIYMEDLVILLKKFTIGCNVTGTYSGVFIYADDITLLAPSCSGLNVMLRMCEAYAEKHRIQFNALKTKCMCFSDNDVDEDIHPNIVFMNSQLSLVNECVLLGIPISKKLEPVISYSLNRLYANCNRVLLDFKRLPFDTQFSLLSSYCGDAYGSQLWCYESRYVNRFYVAWRKIVRRLWNLPYTTHCNLLPGICKETPFDIILESRCIKYTWSCLNNENVYVRVLSIAALNNRRSVMGRNFRYLSFKYKIERHIWFGNLAGVFLYVNRFIASYNNTNQEILIKAGIIRELSLTTCYNDFVGLSHDERYTIICELCTN